MFKHSHKSLSRCWGNNQVVCHKFFLFRLSFTSRNWNDLCWDEEISFARQFILY
jgi:hypothetical protein